MMESNFNPTKHNTQLHDKYMMDRVHIRIANYGMQKLGFGNG